MQVKAIESTRLYLRTAEAKITAGMSATLPRGSESVLGARYQALIRLSQVTSAHHDPKELFRILKDELHRVVTSDHVSLFLYDEAAKKVCPPTLSLLNRPEVPAPLETAPEETATWWVYQHQR